MNLNDELLKAGIYRDVYPQFTTNLAVLARKHADYLEKAARANLAGDQEGRSAAQAVMRQIDKAEGEVLSERHWAIEAYAKKWHEDPKSTKRRSL